MVIEQLVCQCFNRFYIRHRFKIQNRLTTVIDHRNFSKNRARKRKEIETKRFLAIWLRWFLTRNQEDFDRIDFQSNENCFHRFVQFLFSDAALGTFYIVNENRLLFRIFLGQFGLGPVSIRIFYSETIECRIKSNRIENKNEMKLCDFLGSSSTKKIDFQLIDRTRSSPFQISSSTPEGFFQNLTRVRGIFRFFRDKKKREIFFFSRVFGESNRKKTNVCSSNFNRWIRSRIDFSVSKWKIWAKKLKFVPTEIFRWFFIDSARWIFRSNRISNGF